MNYTIYFSGTFSHTLNVSADSSLSAEDQAYQILNENMHIDDYSVDDVSVSEIPVYISLKSFFTSPEKESPETYTSLSSFYATNTSDYNPLYN